MDAVSIPNAKVWWIDDAGAWHEANNSYAERFPDCTLPELTQRQGPLFRELGMIKVAQIGGVVDIQWDVRQASQEAVRSMFYFLLAYETPGSGNFLVTLRYFFGAWNSERFPTTQEALDRISELSACESFEADESITIANVALDHIDESHTDIAWAYTVWRKADGFFKNVPEGDLERLKSRTFSMRPDALGKHFIIVDAGNHSLSVALLGQDWPRLAVGTTPQHCFSDEDYEAAMSEDYAGVMRSGVPKLDHVRAFVHLSGDDPIWLNYERLLLPWRTHAGGPLLMCCSEASQDLDVDFLDATMPRENTASV
ncbi:MAG: hypothetical protein HN644_06940 [Rhodospirillales bacterium]|jgi:hypothetical protein|nr:hypothetical protein [Rhodospirillales bacterium]MBT4040137.1 hypothetical protein [Rhodospirillales bacterium]MBT4625468.1 hypothetical protein [Rhodospirillales bacterium]MBT5352106.1 hypothetical protein [Rhodospirillales bacterium]MBT5521875.1 hypothetical protein [Rhodospirillales bacterium]